MFLLAPATFCAYQAQQDDPAVKRNLRIIQSEVGYLASELMEKAKIGADQKLYVRILSSDTAWLVQNSFLESLKRMNYNIFMKSATEKGSGPTLEIGLAEVRVTYGRAFRESILGRQRSRRVITAVISASVRSAADEVVFAGNLSRIYTDTVRTADIVDLETPSIPFTQGKPPEEGFFDTVLEPAVIIGATAVAIYLFFTVRS